ncbi:MAG: tetratricopeptide repeat protein [Terriglobia bacterium]
MIGVLILLPFEMQGAAAPWQAGTSLASLQAQLDRALDHEDHLQSQQIVRDILAQPNLTLDFLLRLGIRLAEAGNYAEASLVFGHGVARYPQSFEAHYNLALADLAQQRYREARSALQAARALNGEQQVALQYLRGKIEASLGDASAAKQDLQAAFHNRPNNESYALDLGLFDLRTYAYRPAVTVFSQGLAHNPHSEYLELGLALGQFLAGETAKSRATTERLLQHHPHLSAAQLLLAYSLYIDGKFAAAGTITRQGAESQGPHPYLDYLDAAIALKLHSSNHARSLAELKRAEQEIPQCSLCYVAESKVHQEMNARDNALKDLQTAVQLDPALPEAWYRLAIVEDLLGRHAEAADARSRFENLKAKRSSQENEMLRSAFIKSLQN